MDRTADFRAGQIVIALAGREAGCRFVIVGVSDNRLLLADGKKRTVGRPKRKNPCHVRVLSGRELPAVPMTDEAVRKALREAEEEVKAEWPSKM
ncbi:MAG: hypothetical protein ACM3ZC_13160 [Bacteroidota bacterium]